MNEAVICSIPGCEKPSRARTWCFAHYMRWRRNGNPYGASVELAAKPGERYGQLVVIGDTGSRRGGSQVWACRCDCGRSKNVRACNLRNGKVKSCGCLRTTHGESKGANRTVEYGTWKSMHSRCKHESNPGYPWYGGRGIRVCSRWSGEGGYERFLADMGRRPGDDWSIDRIDPDKGYEPENCRWLPLHENSMMSRKLRAENGTFVSTGLM